MVETWILALAGLGILLQAFTAYLSYSVYKQTEVPAGWFFVTVALTLVTARRLLSFLYDLGAAQDIADFVKSIEVFLLLFISAIQLYGYWHLKNTAANYGMLPRERIAELQQIESNVQARASASLATKKK